MNKLITSILSLILLSCSTQPNIEYMVAPDDYEATPTIIIPPIYPSRAAKAKVEGYVNLVFNIDDKGYPCDIRITGAKPEAVFGKSARDALKLWRFKPYQENGKPKPISNVEYTLQFNLAD